MGCYDDFAPFYDRFIRSVDYVARAEYFDRLIRPLLHEEKTLLLDLACGTGSLSIELARLGHEVIGVDGSSEMLSFAQQKAEQAEQKILFLQERMERLNLGTSIDCCVCALDSLNHLTSLKSLRRTFENVSAHLLPEGVFVFDLNTPYKHRVLLADNCYCYEEGDTMCVWQNHTEDLLTHIDLDFFTVQADGRYCRAGESFDERGYERAEIEALLMSCGLQLLAVYSDDTLLPPTDATQRWIYLTKKEK